MFSVLRKFAACLAVSFLASVAVGQVAPGTYSYGTFDNNGTDTINVGSLNIHLNLPVLNKPGRGLPFYYNLSYDSSVWTVGSVSGLPAWVPVQNFGWQGQTDGPLGYVTFSAKSAQCQGDDGPETYSFQTNYVYYDAYGSAHPYLGLSILIGADRWGCSGLSRTATSMAVDGSGYSISVSATTATVTTKAGATITPPLNGGTTSGTIVDTNGNEISLNGGGQFTDTTGNVALTVAGTAPSPQTFTYKDTSGNPQAVTITYATYSVQTAFGCGGVGEYGPTPTPLVSSITYPDNSSYTFTYEATPGVSGHVTGRLAEVQLRQGGVITYTYTGGGHGITCSDGSASGLTRTLAANAGSAASTWTYTRTAPNGAGTSQTAVLDGLGNNKVFNFIEASNQPSGTVAEYYETNRNIFQGPATGTPVVSRSTCYNGEASPCTTSTFTVPIAQIDTYETLNGVAMLHGTRADYNTYGMQTEAIVYDFGTAATRGPVLRNEVWAYGYSIANLPTSDEVFDVSGNVAAKTLYTYDGSTPTVSSGVPQHVAVTGPRGNLTSETVYASAPQHYGISATYEDTGSLLTSTGPTGTTTSSYDSTFVYTTGVQLPTPSSGVSLLYTGTYDTADTGLPLSVTDPNTQATHNSSFDSMLRLLEVDSPDGGKATLSYTPTQSVQKEPVAQIRTWG